MIFFFRLQRQTILTNVWGSAFSLQLRNLIMSTGFGAATIRLGEHAFAARPRYNNHALPEDIMIPPRIPAISVYPQFALGDSSLYTSIDISRLAAC